MVDVSEPQSQQPIRVFLLDDHDFIRRGLDELIQATSDVVVVGEAATAAEALEQLPVVRPDVALLDVVLPDGSGIEVCREVRSQRPETRCLMLTSHDDDEALFAAVMAGASGYLTKQIQGTGFLPSIRRAAAGEVLIPAVMARRVVEQLRAVTETAALPPGQRAAPSEPGTLSERQWQIVEEIAAGQTDAQIAEALGLPEPAVRAEVAVVFAKLALQRRSRVTV